MAMQVGVVEHVGMCVLSLSSLPHVLMSMRVAASAFRTHVAGKLETISQLPPIAQASSSSSRAVSTSPSRATSPASPQPGRVSPWHRVRQTFHVTFQLQRSRSASELVPQAADRSPQSRRPSLQGGGDNMAATHPRAQSAEHVQQKSGRRRSLSGSRSRRGSGAASEAGGGERGSRGSRRQSLSLSPLGVGRVSGGSRTHPAASPHSSRSRAGSLMVSREQGMTLLPRI